MSLHGIIPMLVTPFDESGAVRATDIPHLVEALVGDGADAIAALGLGGEVGALLPGERQAVAEKVVAAAHTAGRPAVIGVSADDTATARELARHAAELGADAISIAPPARPGISREELGDHYRRVVDGADGVPVIVQDAPAFIGVALDAAFVAELARDRLQVTYAKTEVLPVGDAVAELTSLPGITVLGGHAGLYLLDVLDAGAVGAIPGSEAVAALAAASRAFAAGDRDLAASHHARVLPLLVSIFATLPHYLSCTKIVLAQRGLISTSATRLGSNVSSREAARLLALASRAGVL